MERFETMKKLEYSDDGKCVYGGRAVKGRIDFPEGVTEIASCAFMDREKLRSVTFPNSLVEIGRQAFWNCQSLTLDALPQNLRSLGIGAFAFTGVHGSLTIPSGVTRIESQAFKGCNIWSVSFSPKLTEIGSCAFRLNNLLHEVELRRGDALVQKRLQASLRRIPFRQRVAADTEELHLGVMNVAERYDSACGKIVRDKREMRAHHLVYRLLVFRRRCAV